MRKRPVRIADLELDRTQGGGGYVCVVRLEKHRKRGYAFGFTMRQALRNAIRHALDPDAL